MARIDMICWGESSHHNIFVISQPIQCAGPHRICTHQAESKMSRNLLFSFPQKAIEGTVGCQCFVYAITSWIVITGLTFFPQALQKRIGHDNTFNSLFFTMICLTFLCLCSLSKLCRCPPRSITTSTTWTSRPLSPRNRTKLYSSKC